MWFKRGVFIHVERNGEAERGMLRLDCGRRSGNLPGSESPDAIRRPGRGSVSFGGGISRVRQAGANRLPGVGYAITKNERPRTAKASGGRSAARRVTQA